MVLSLRKKPTHGLSLLTSYTYAKSLNYNSSFFGSNGESGAFADPRNPSADYGPSAFDLRQQFVFSYLYEMPFGKGRMLMHNANAVVDNILGGWNLGGIVNWHTGFPFTIFANTAQDFSGFNQFADRANAGNTPLTFNYGDPTHAFPTTQCPANPCYFSMPGAGSIGNMGRNAFNGPNYTDFDLSLQKNFSVSEGKRFQLRAEFFNLFNHPNFNLPTSNLGSSSAGKITSVYGNSRLVQLGLRFDF